MDKVDVLIVGAGLAGLHLAGELVRAGRSVRVLERDDAVGGRVQTDVVDGFLLDRGFQVFLTAYPTASKVFDYAALDLRPFEPGALIHSGSGNHRLSDPARRPAQAISTLAAPVGTLADKMRMLRLRTALEKKSVEQLLNEPEQSTLDALAERWGFSDAMIERFFRPFIGGVTFDKELGSSSRFFHFVMKMFGAGDAVVPAGGMKALPEQLAARLPQGTVHLNAEVAETRTDGVTLADGTQTQATHVVLATGGFSALEASAGTSAKPRAVTTLYFTADVSPLEDPVLVLDGERSGPVNNVAVMSDVASTYAPAGKTLISATVLEDSSDLDTLTVRARTQMSQWFGASVRNWTLLKAYQIPTALPDQTALTSKPVRIESGLFACGDHRDHGSIEGALVSAERTAVAVLESLETL